MEKALATGAIDAVVEDLRHEFVDEAVFPALRANAVYEWYYLLGTSLARPIITQGLVRAARAADADAIAHGATGKGNDQVRFELSAYALEPDIEVIAPWREWNLRGRADLVDYAKEHGIAVPVTPERPYSMDANLLHVSYEGGVLEDPWESPPAGMFRMTADPERAPDRPEVVTVEFRARHTGGGRWQRRSIRSGLLTGSTPPVADTGWGGSTSSRTGSSGSRAAASTRRRAGRFSTTPTERWSRSRSTARWRTCATSWCPATPRWSTTGSGSHPSARRCRPSWMRSRSGSTARRGSGSTRGRSPSRDAAPRRHDLYDQATATFEEDDVYDQADAAGFIRLNALRLRRLAEERLGEGE